MDLSLTDDQIAILDAIDTLTLVGYMTNNCCSLFDIFLSFN